MGRWSTGVWRRKVIKGYHKRAMKFREESKTPEEIVAWSKVIQWFDSILRNTIMNHNEAIALPRDLGPAELLEAEEHTCGSSGLHPGQPCRSFCYMTEMMAKGWQSCPHLESDNPSKEAEGHA